MNLNQEQRLHKHNLNIKQRLYSVTWGAMSTKTNNTWPEANYLRSPDEHDETELRKWENKTEKGMQQS